MNFKSKKISYSLKSTLKSIGEVRDLDLSDSKNGDVIEVLNGSGLFYFFWIDKNDNSSIDDGVSVIVSSDGTRVKAISLGLTGQETDFDGGRF